MYKTIRCLLLAAAAASPCFATASTDEELRERIVGFIRPHCGGNRIEGVREPTLMEVLDISNDTSRLARILAEVAQTNNAWYAEKAMWQLEEYGTPAQLPFLYSCATNPASWVCEGTPTRGDRAMKAALRIEAVTSNSIEILRHYLLAPRQKQFVDWDRSAVCEYMVSLAKATPLSTEGTNRVMSCLLQYAPLNNICPKELDRTITSFDPNYAISQRRLSVLRAVNILGVDEFEISYVTNAINELVAYPEANLPE